MSENIIIFQSDGILRKQTNKNLSWLPNSQMKKPQKAATVKLYSSAQLNATLKNNWS